MRSPGPNTPEFVDYIAVTEQRSIHKPMQPWHGVQIGNEFQQKPSSHGGSTKHSMLNLQVIDPPASNPQQIWNCYDYERWENVTGDPAAANDEQAFQLPLHTQFSFGPGQMPSAAVLNSIHL